MKKMKKRSISLIILTIFMSYILVIYPQETSYQLLWSYQIDSEISFVTISSDESYVAALDEENNAYIICRDSGTLLKSTETKGYITSISILHDGSIRATGTKIAKRTWVYLYNGLSQYRVREFNTYHHVRCVAVSQDGSYIAAGGIEGKVSLFNSQTIDRKTTVWKYHTGESIDSIALSADGSYISVAVTGYFKYGVYLFSRENDNPLWRSPIEADSVAISADGSSIVAVNHLYPADEIFIFSQESNTPLWSYTTDNLVSSISLSHDGSYLAIGTTYENKGEVYFFRKEGGTPLWSYQTTNGVNSISISSNGSTIVVGSGDTVYLFSVNDGGNAQPTVTSSTVGPEPSLTKNSLSYTSSSSVAATSDVEESTVLSSGSSRDVFDPGTGFSIAHPAVSYLLVGGIGGVLVVVAVMMYRRRGGRVSVIHCPKCGAENPVEQKYCGNCAFNLEDKTQIY